MILPPKARLPNDQSSSKNHRAAKFLSSSELFCVLAGVREERVGFAVYRSHTHKRSNRRFANFFFLPFFLFGKEKMGTFSPSVSEADSSLVRESRSAFPTFHTFFTENRCFLASLCTLCFAKSYRVARYARRRERIS